MSMEEKTNFQTFQDSNYQPSEESQVKQFIADCYHDNIPIEVIGSGSKRSIGRNIQVGKTISLSNLSGILDYKPEELYIKVKAGTPIKMIIEELKKNNQQLAFEPNDFGQIYGGKENFGTIGGVVSCNFAGPRRFKSGSVRDHILGFKAVNGKGEVIKSGGTVVKNVTGYDLSKLISGAFGTLVVLTELTIKVLPLLSDNKTLIINNLSNEDALDSLSKCLSSSTDPTAGVFFPEMHRQSFIFNDMVGSGSITAIRYEGSKKSVDHRIDIIRKSLKLKVSEVNILETSQSTIFWKQVSGLKVFSQNTKNLVRVVLPPKKTKDFLKKINSDDYFVDWGGSLIWIKLDEANSETITNLRNWTNENDGYLTVIKADENIKNSLEIFGIESNKYKISELIKKSFDPKKILNTGKMYPGI